MENLTIKTPRGKRVIGQGEPVFIVAEMSANHLQDFNRALKIIDAASQAGADAVKLQTYTPDTITLDCDKDYFQIKVNDIWKEQTLYQLYKKAYTPWEWQPKLKDYGEKKGLKVFSTGFDTSAIDFLEKMKVGLYKIASFEVVDIPLLKRIGQTNKPVIMSRGLASIEEIELTIKTLKENGCPQIAILHCISSYPAEPEEMNLATISDIAERFKVVTGLSCHSLSIAPAVSSVALGAKIIEKHLTLSRDDKGPDAPFSLEPDEFKELVKSVRQVEKAIGKPNYSSTKGETGNKILRKSLFVVKDIKKGEKFTKENVRSIRPGYGLAPKYYDEIIDKTAATDIERGMPLSWQVIEGLQKNYQIRPVKKEDCRSIWEIRNHPLVRKYATLNDEEIPFNKHKIWFNNYLKNKNNLCYVLEKAGKVLGYCRFDMKNGKQRISIAVDPKFHSQGLGNYLLSNSIKRLRDKKNLIANIKRNNKISLRLFQKNNFKIDTEAEDPENYCLEYTKT